MQGASGHVLVLPFWRGPLLHSSKPKVPDLGFQVPHPGMAICRATWWRFLFPPPLHSSPVSCQRANFVCFLFPHSIINQNTLEFQNSQFGFPGISLSEVGKRTEAEKANIAV